MLPSDCKVALITGGTRGIGLETALAFGKYGITSVITSRWGLEDEDVFYKHFENVGAPTPLVITADVVSEEDAEKLFSRIINEFNCIDIFVSNVSQALRIDSFADYTLKGLKQSISYSSWPFFSYTMKIKDTFGQYPRYIVGVSSTGPDYYSAAYDYVAASKIVLETFCKYMTYRLRDENVCINVVRSRAVKTQSFENTFGKELQNFAKRFAPDNYWMDVSEVANAIVALCSGLLDSMKGQIVNVDRGTSFFDNIMELYTRRHEIMS